MKIDQIALQLYTVREYTAKDFIGTLRELARIGYSAVEFAGYGGVPMAEMRAALDELGLRAIGAHVPYDHFDTRFREVVSELHTLGCEHAIVPWLRPEMRTPHHITTSMGSSSASAGGPPRAGPRVCGSVTTTTTSSLPRPAVAPARLFSTH